MGTRLKLAVALEATAGGTRKHVRELALGLDPKRFDVHLVLSFNRSNEMRADVERLEARGITVHSIPIPRTIRPVEDTRALNRMLALFRVEKFDVLHTQGSKTGFLGRLAGRMARIPHVYHTPHVWPFQWTRPPASRLYLQLERLAAGWCDGIVCVGREQLDIGKAAGVMSDDKMVVIPNGVEARCDIDYAHRKALREALGVGDNEVSVGMVARLAPQKGVGRFIEAAAQVIRRGTSARFFLVGGGRLESEMRSRARSLGLGPGSLSFLGHREDVEQLYAGFDVFVLSSLYEGLPYVLLEAMAAGLPVVATKVTGTEEVVEDGVTGRLVPPHNAAAIADAIDGLVRDPEQLRAFGEAGLKRVKKQFPLRRFVKKHADLYTNGLKSEA